MKAGAITDLAVFQSTGAAVAAGKEFALFQKNWKNRLTVFDKIDPAKVTYGNSKKTSPRVPRVVEISNIVPVADKLYSVRIVIRGYGSLSTENEYLKDAFYKSKTGDDAENIVDGLVKSLARNFSREQPESVDTFDYTLKDTTVVKLRDNLVFSFAKSGTGANAKLVISEKSDWLSSYYETGRKDRLDVDYTVEYDFPSVATLTNTAVGSLGIGTGYQVRNMEYYYLGNRQDTLREMAYPHNFPTHYDSKLDSQYHIIDLEYYDEGRDDRNKSKKQLVIAIEDLGVDTEGTISYPVANALITDLNTAIDGLNGVIIPSIPTNPA